jgi:hypothetical protein
MDISKEDREYFEAVLSDVLGVDVPTLHRAIEFVGQQQTEHALKPVREAWGESFDENFSKTKEYYASLSEDQQAFYDNPDGLMYLFDTKVKPTLGQVESPSGDVPSIATNAASQVATAPTKQGLTREAIKAMTPAEYKDNSAAITAFYAQAQSA